MLYRSKTLRVLWPLIFIATVSGRVLASFGDGFEDLPQEVILALLDEDNPKVTWSGARGPATTAGVVAYLRTVLRNDFYDRVRIALSRAVTDEGRRRFTLAHELGHYILPSHAQSDSPCRPKDIERWDPSLQAREVEANRFAAVALMPRQTIADLFNKKPSFRAVEEIVHRRGTSFTVSAYRYVQLSGERIAVVWSERGESKWAKGTDELYRRVTVGPLDHETLAWRLFHDGNVPDDFDRVPRPRGSAKGTCRTAPRSWSTPSDSATMV